MHLDLILTRPEVLTAVGTLAGSALGALLHKLSLKYHVRITKGEVVTAAAILDAVVPAAKAEVDAVAKLAEAAIAATVAEVPAPVVAGPTPVEPPHAVTTVAPPNPIGFAPPVGR